MIEDSTDALKEIEGAEHEMESTGNNLWFNEDMIKISIEAEKAVCNRKFIKYVSHNALGAAKAFVF